MNEFTVDEKLKILSMKEHARNVAIDFAYEPYVVFAGGVFTSWYHYEEPKDFDFFILSDHYTGTSVHLQIRDRILSKWPDTVDTTHHYVRDNANIHSVMSNKANKRQFIFTSYTSREELIKHFDYAHCMVSYQNDKLFISRHTFDALRKKELIVNNAKQVKPWRKEKFLARGFIEPFRPVQYSSPYPTYPTYPTAPQPVAQFTTDSFVPNTITMHRDMATDEMVIVAKPQVTASGGSGGKNSRVVRITYQDYREWLADNRINDDMSTINKVAVYLYEKFKERGTVE